MIQIVLTPAAGKRLIAKAIAKHPAIQEALQSGTIAVALQAVIGRRVHLIFPVGLEKRICGNLDEIASRLNEPSFELI